MPLTLANDIWSELKRYISSVDKEEAAETLVNILIDNDFDAEEIKQEFKGDSFIKQALSQYLKDEPESEDEEYDDDTDEY
jgi:hypothetical protein